MKSNRESFDGVFGAALEEVLEICMELWSIPAVGPENGGDGEEEKARRLLGLLGGTGVFPDPLRLDSADPRVSTGRRPNIAYLIPGQSDEGGRLWIMLHLDVVPPGDPAEWSSPPFEPLRRDGRIYGRGTEDNGGGTAAALTAVLACLRSGHLPSRNLGLLFVSDEEVSSEHGIINLIRRDDLFKAGDLFLVPDGGRPDGLEIETAEKGLLWFRFRLRGTQGHASRPDQVPNVRTAAARLVLSVAAMESRFSARDERFSPPGSTFVPTRVESPALGVNVIPAEEIFYADCRVLPGYGLDEVVREANERARRVALETGTSIDVEVVDRTEASSTDPDHPFCLALGECVRQVRGVMPAMVGAGGSTVAAYLRAAGFPALVWCSENGTAHQVDENVSISAIRDDAEVIYRLILGR
jgi:succinyl-diaminopimelate desuccinylase